MLYFSATVWVLTSSSLPFLEGALESSKGEAKGPARLSLLPASELQLVLLDDMAESVEPSWYGLGARIFPGGSNISFKSVVDAPAPEP